MLMNWIQSGTKSEKCLVVGNCGYILCFRSPALSRATPIL